MKGEDRKNQIISISQSIFSKNGYYETHVEEIIKEAKAGDHIVIMSNGGFQGVHKKMLAALEAVHAN